MLDTKEQYMKESNTNAANVTNSILVRNALLNIKGQYMKYATIKQLQNSVLLDTKYRK